MKKKLLIAILCLCLSACAAQPRYLPIPTQCPKPQIAKEPDYLPITKTMPHNEVIKALIVNYKLCQIDAAAIRKQCGG